jgi:Protein of unknown function (DUF3040)
VSAKVRQLALHGEDRARLRQIEARLALDDPTFVARVRAWRPPAGRQSAPDEYSALRPWMVVVFLVGFATWGLAPAVGVVVGLVGVGWVRWTTGQRRVTPAGAAGGSPRPR